MLFTYSLTLDLLGITVALIVILVAWHLWALGYWKRKGIQGPEPIFGFGTMKDFFLQKKTMGKYFAELYNVHKPKGSRFVPCYFSGQASLVLIDIDLVKSILQNDFPTFHTRGQYYDDRDPMSLGLFSVDGPRWRNIRTKLTPAFTSGKIKMMHRTMIVCADLLKEVLNDSLNNPVDIKDIFARFTTDVIGSVAFGIRIRSLTNPDLEFRRQGKAIFHSGLANLLRFASPLFVPHTILRFFNFQTHPKERTEFFINLTDSTLKYREENNVSRKDFMDMMLKMKNSSDPRKQLTFNEIVGQCITFFAAGFETSSTTAYFAAFELAQNQDIQEKLRKDVNRILSKYNNVLSYEAVAEMEYLGQVILETLRKYPALAMLWRKCTKKYKLSGEDLEIDPGTNVFIPVQAIHYDLEYYPNPDKFDPDRFTEENKKTRPAFTWIPFGEGPRICIGMRFGIHQTKVALLTLVTNFRFRLNKKTKLPLTFSKSGITLTSVEKIWLDLEKI